MSAAVVLLLFAMRLSSNHILRTLSFGFVWLVSAEIVRGGVLSVERGQSEAAQALGLGRGRIFRRIVLPQAMPAIIPVSGKWGVAGTDEITQSTRNPAPTF